MKGKTRIRDLLTLQQYLVNIGRVCIGLPGFQVKPQDCLVINTANAFTIQTVQPLQSVFAVSGQSVTDQYGRIILSSTRMVMSTSVAAAWTAAGPRPTGGIRPFVRATVKVGRGSKIVVRVLCDIVLVFRLRRIRGALKLFIGLAECYTGTYTL